VTVNGAVLRTGDAAAANREETLVLTGVEPSEILLFDLA